MGGKRNTCCVSGQGNLPCPLCILGCGKNRNQQAMQEIPDKRRNLLKKVPQVNVMILDRVYDANNRLTSLSRYKGQWVFLVGRCPQCKKRVGKESIEIVDPTDPPMYRVSDITCCRRFFPTKAALVHEGRVAEVSVLGESYKDDPGDMATDADSWSLYMLWDAGRKLDKPMMPTPPDAGSIQASEWLARILSLVSDPGLFRDFALSSAEKMARQVQKKKLYRDFWGMVPVIYNFSTKIVPE